MAETTLVVASASTLLVAFTYLYVGLRLARRSGVSDASARALLFFALWWLATSANQILGSSLYLAAAFGFRDLALQLAYVLIQRLLLAISLVGLMYYLLYLQTGRDHLLALVAVYAFYYVVAVYSVVARGPIGVESFGWRTDLVFARSLPPAWGLQNLLIVAPPVIGSLLLLRVYKRVEGRTRRFRIAMLAGGFVVWWITAIVAGNPATYDVTALQVANRLVGLAVALGILAAFEPLPWMVRRMGFERQALS